MAQGVLAIGQASFIPQKEVSCMQDMCSPCRDISGWSSLSQPEQHLWKVLSCEPEASANVSPVPVQTAHQEVRQKR